MKEKEIIPKPLKFKKTAADALEVNPPKRSANTCECGCGGIPKGKKSRFLPGHDLRKAYKESKG